jgi:hypothetical protein
LLVQTKKAKLLAVGNEPYATWASKEEALAVAGNWEVHGPWKHGSWSFN